MVADGGTGRDLLENNRPEPAISCDGDPVPDRVTPAILPPGFSPPDMPNGDRMVCPVDVSFGDGLADGDVDRVWVADCGEYPTVK